MHTASRTADAQICLSCLASSTQVHEDRLIDMIEQLTSGRSYLLLCAPALVWRMYGGAWAAVASCPHARPPPLLSSHQQHVACLQPCPQRPSPFLAVCECLAADRLEGRWLIQVDVAAEGDRLVVREKKEVRV